MKHPTLFNLHKLQVQPNLAAFSDSYTASVNQKNELSDDDAPNARSGRRNLEGATGEDLDESGLPDRHDVDAKFRKAERRRGTDVFSGINDARFTILILF